RIADSINDIALEAALSRRQLERKFRDWLGRTPAEEIRRLRLARVRELLAETDLSVAEIAKASGFSSLEYMSTAFKSATGLTPLRYRSTVRAR
ncbi:MAG: helix-turn-helix transcriptional regulator, partial [Firmicutes bacterium]|nr:helix-turn-helix transcriptional regulator [Bacillota bacterium]